MALVYDILLLICTQLPLQKVFLGYDVGLVQVATVSILTTCRQGVLFQTRLRHPYNHPDNDDCSKETIVEKYPVSHTNKSKACTTKTRPAEPVNMTEIDINRPFPNDEYVLVDTDQ
ncbi:hypothetical protein P5673_006061 [Acropora cervicornis]|uniref:Uncharacterized protein n=1 Tax=Acropora cervicornis TaxID=6130 RepID=A0AAD9VCD9_ACRCE|nr:hypothetical protein P5673_006061 [Acropora cervicornis]